MAIPPNTPMQGPTASDPSAVSGAPPIDDGSGGEDTGPDVLLTVIKLPDGYKLIKGDDEDGAADGAMSADVSAPAAPGSADDGGGKVYQDKGSLLKAILDMLNENESSSGAPGSSDDQFQSGFSDDDSQAGMPVQQKF